ncbi:DUF3347 domain-containing protein [uncultured Chitinophaga sp.]|jgi:Protein of unknown function (DUF3347).|uniref:DUF3347 domain-containing protein n=1 Tax=uncultured Chitinophaga sp. TaxID=339340 RepID=UPI00260EB5A8|nr:DUF3347 domain-containing protein [uncultured Chitinophaga sp.]
MLKQAMKAGIPVLTMILLAACGGGNNNAAKENAAAHEDHATTAPAAPVKLKDEKANGVYQHYVHLTTALINSDAAEAKVAGTAIAESAKELDNAAAIADNAQKIAAASSLADQRELYALLSKDVIALVKSSGLSSGELYVDYCPMANNDKGANWLSAAAEIKNPYFGDQMLTCGEVEETIK